MKALTMKERESDTMKSAAIELKKQNLLIKKAKKTMPTAYEKGDHLFTMNELMAEIRNGRLTRENAFIYFEVNKEDFLKRYEDECSLKNSMF